MVQDGKLRDPQKYHNSSWWGHEWLWVSNFNGDSSSRSPKPQDLSSGDHKYLHNILLFLFQSGPNWWISWLCYPTNNRCHNNNHSVADSWTYVFIVCHLHIILHNLIVITVDPVTLSDSTVSTLAASFEGKMPIHSPTYCPHFISVFFQQKLLPGTF